VAARFTRNTIDLIVARWLALSGSTVISHLTLYLVAGASLRGRLKRRGVVGAGARRRRVRTIAAVLFPIPVVLPAP
jgi:hypothetical protein